MKMLKSVISISVFLCLFISCVGGTSSKKVKAGAIDYKIIWNSSRANALPKTARLVYSDEGCCFEFEKILSFVSLRFNKNFKRDSASFLINMAGMGTYANIPMENVDRNMSKMRCIKLSERKKILNYNCNTIQYTGANKDVRVKVYYSKKLNIDVVNKLFPEIETKGAVLAVELQNKNEKVYIEATKISERDVDASLFEIPKDYAKNSYKQILNVLNGFVK